MATSVVAFTQLLVCCVHTVGLAVTRVYEAVTLHRKLTWRRPLSQFLYIKPEKSGLYVSTTANHHPFPSAFSQSPSLPVCIQPITIPSRLHSANHHPFPSAFSQSPSLPVCIQPITIPSRLHYSTSRFHIKLTLYLTLYRGFRTRMVYLKHVI